MARSDLNPSVGYLACWSLTILSIEYSIFFHEFLRLSHQLQLLCFLFYQITRKNDRIYLWFSILNRNLGYLLIPQVILIIYKPFNCKDIRHILDRVVFSMLWLWVRWEWYEHLDFGLLLFFFLSGLANMGVTFIIQLDNLLSLKF
ncbi:hypothetical protein FGO68_gene6152 [Halteria grandinella]|uniref:Uncharacterized protein n=1 Tax=Halteria grandinella TaxID=5974 RepID=A0A8J8NEU5_HALGN|nr:hypothetical protein FGO68_gene6152 [Halteria grandinella]